MKLVSLNTWGSAQGKLFYDYILDLAPSTDIFCFQEVFSSGLEAPKIFSSAHMRSFQEISAMLPEFIGHFEEKSSGYADDSLNKAPWPVIHGLAMFVRKNIAIKKYSSEIIGDSVLTGGPPLEGLVKVQVMTLAIAEKDFHVINIHGQSRPGEKLDTPERLQQSQLLLEIIEKLPKNPVILCGDFNLMPETQSIKMLAEKLSNLIEVYQIKNTRNEISWEKYHNRQLFADYAFTSLEVKVNSFEVPYNLVSDHLPMLLDFEI